MDVESETFCGTLSAIAKMANPLIFAAKLTALSLFAAFAWWLGGLVADWFHLPKFAPIFVLVGLICLPVVFIFFNPGERCLKFVFDGITFFWIAFFCLVVFLVGRWAGTQLASWFSLPETPTITITVVVLLAPIALMIARLVFASRTQAPPDSSPFAAYRDTIPSAEKVFDVFVSYKSEDSRMARLITNQLIAAGLRPWFAEYMILSDKFEEFQKLIDRGIRHSKRGLALTNDLYVQSKYTRKELKHLLGEGGCGASNILTVRCPKSDAFEKDSVSWNIISIGTRTRRIRHSPRSAIGWESKAWLCLICHREK